MGGRERFMGRKKYKKRWKINDVALQAREKRAKEERRGQNEDEKKVKGRESFMGKKEYKKREKKC